MAELRESSTDGTGEEDDDDIVIIDATPPGNQKIQGGLTSDRADEENETEGEASHREMGGAAAAGGLLGLLFVGPAFAIAAGIGVAVASTTKSKAGEVARASGEVMASVGDRITKWDQKHHVLDKVSDTVIKLCKDVSQKIKRPGDNTAETGEINTTI